MPIVCQTVFQVMRVWVCKILYRLLSIYLSQREYFSGFVGLCGWYYVCWQWSSSMWEVQGVS